MRRPFPAVIVLLALLALYPLLAKELWQQRAETRRQTQAGYVLPSKFSRLLALEHDGLLADFLFLRTITFYGERVMYEQKMSEEDWGFIVGSLEVITDLDPYFLDPYIVAEGLLTWEAGKIEDANRLLERGRRARASDWQIPFFLGFNYFYFLKDYQKGAAFLMEASRLPESPAFLPSLAARLGYYGGKTETAVMFLKGILAQTTDAGIRKRLEKRVLALERAAHLEDLVEKYKTINGMPPRSPQDLVTSGLVRALPADPYGGDWVIVEGGRIFSTSKFVGGGK